MDKSEPKVCVENASTDWWVALPHLYKKLSDQLEQYRQRQIASGKSEEDQAHTRLMVLVEKLNELLRLIRTGALPEIIQTAVDDEKKTWARFLTADYDGEEKEEQKGDLSAYLLDLMGSDSHIPGKVPDLQVLKQQRLDNVVITAWPIFLDEIRNAAMSTHSDSSLTPDINLTELLMSLIQLGGFDFSLIRNIDDEGKNFVIDVKGKQQLERVFASAKSEGLVLPHLGGNDEYVPTVSPSLAECHEVLDVAITAGRSPSCFFINEGIVAADNCDNTRVFSDFEAYCLTKGLTLHSQGLLHAINIVEQNNAPTDRLDFISAQEKLQAGRQITRPDHLFAAYAAIVQHIRGIKRVQLLAMYLPNKAAPNFYQAVKSLLSNLKADDLLKQCQARIAHLSPAAAQPVTVRRPCVTVLQACMDRSKQLAQESKLIQLTYNIDSSGKRFFAFQKESFVKHGDQYSNISNSMSASDLETLDKDLVLLYLHPLLALLEQLLNQAIVYGDSPRRLEQLLHEVVYLNIHDESTLPLLSTPAKRALFMEVLENHALGRELLDVFGRLLRGEFNYLRNNPLCHASVYNQYLQIAQAFNFKEADLKSWQGVNGSLKLGVIENQLQKTVQSTSKFQRLKGPSADMVSVVQEIVIAYCVMVSLAHKEWMQYERSLKHEGLSKLIEQQRLLKKFAASVKAAEAALKLAFSMVPKVTLPISADTINELWNEYENSFLALSEKDLKELKAISWTTNHIPTKPWWQLLTELSSYLRLSCLSNVEAQAFAAKLDGLLSMIRCGETQVGAELVLNYDSDSTASDEGDSTTEYSQSSTESSSIIDESITASGSSGDDDCTSIGDSDDDKTSTTDLTLDTEGENKIDDVTDTDDELNSVSDLTSSSEAKSSTSGATSGGEEDIISETTSNSELMIGDISDDDFSSASDDDLETQSNLKAQLDKLRQELFDLDSGYGDSQSALLVEINRAFPLQMVLDALDALENQGYPSFTLGTDKQSNNNKTSSSKKKANNQKKEIEQDKTKDKSEIPSVISVITDVTGQISWAYTTLCLSLDEKLTARQISLAACDEWLAVMMLDIEKNRIDKQHVLYYLHLKAKLHVEALLGSVISLDELAQYNKLELLPVAHKNMTEAIYHLKSLAYTADLINKHAKEDQKVEESLGAYINTLLTDANVTFLLQLYQSIMVEMDPAAAEPAVTVRIWSEVLGLASAEKECRIGPCAGAEFTEFNDIMEQKLLGDASVFGNKIIHYVVKPSLTRGEILKFLATLIYRYAGAIHDAEKFQDYLETVCSGNFSLAKYFFVGNELEDLEQQGLLEVLHGTLEGRELLQVFKRILSGEADFIHEPIFSDGQTLEEIYTDFARQASKLNILNHNDSDSDSGCDSEDELGTDCASILDQEDETLRALQAKLDTKQDDPLGYLLELLQAHLHKINVIIALFPNIADKKNMAEFVETQILKERLSVALEKANVDLEKAWRFTPYQLEVKFVALIKSSKQSGVQRAVKIRQLYQLFKKCSTADKQRLDTLLYSKQYQARYNSLINNKQLVKESEKSNAAAKRRRVQRQRQRRRAQRNQHPSTGNVATNGHS